MPCGLLQERGSRPEVRREREVLGPQFPHLESRGDHTSFSGRWSQERREHAFRDHTVPGAQRGLRAAALSLRGDPRGLWPDPRDCRPQVPLKQGRNLLRSATEALSSPQMAI